MQQNIIDRAASKAAMTAEYKIKHWAQRHGFSDDTVKAYFYGRFKEDACRAIQIAAALEADGFARYLSARGGRSRSKRTVRVNCKRKPDSCQ